MNFARFYQTLHAREPFPWQARLAQRAADGRWPDALNLPTSSGKTAVLDVWLWAHTASTPCTPRRLYYLIDRRILVDTVADYASDLFARTGMPGKVVRLRGGVGAADDTWMLDPSGLAVISTTLDQVGSRLLCRAYGASRWAAPVHAGLVGNDALIVIDEAHLVEPFRQTLQRVQRYRIRAAEPVTAPWHVLTMTATPVAAGADMLELSEADRAHPVLSRRLTANKLARLLRGGVSDLVAEARRHRDLGADVVGVVVNTVDTARAIHRVLAARDECLLVMGRARPVERDALGQEVLDRAGCGTRAAGRRPLYVVATQTIEVGLDLDFDALVSELAPVSALRQRFGRLDRLGELGTSAASIVKVPAAKWPYPTEQLEDAWAWLVARAEKVANVGNVTNVGIAAHNDAPAEPRLSAPILGLPDLALLFDPAIDIDITSYLHGEQRSTETFVAWRVALDALPQEQWADAVEEVPPSGLELMPVPLHALKRWLSGGEAQASDLESTREPEDTKMHGPPVTVLRWEGETAELVNVAALRPSDVVVLPASQGGCDRYGWHPSSRDVVRDLWEEGLVPKPRWSGSNERTRRAIGLAEHMAGVGLKAASFARSCGLPESTARALDEAGRLHDLGKNDARFQLMLGAFDGRLLAKSGEHEVAVSRRLAGLPHGWRHELGSVAQRADIDPLVRYLVGTHHGRGRPWMPATPDPILWRKAHADDWPELATQMQDRFGFWGMCYLEAILRLADWARSAEEQTAAQQSEEQHAA